MKKTWFELSVAVMIVIRRGNSVLLGRRQNTGFKDGLYALPGGKHDGYECLKSTVAREAKEELGIDVLPNDIVFQSCIHYINYPIDQELLYMVFEIAAYEGDIHNAEPDRCDDLQFFPLDDLPDSMTDMTGECIQNTLAGVRYSEYGF